MTRIISTSITTTKSANFGDLEEEEELNNNNNKVIITQNNNTNRKPEVQKLVSASNAVTGMYLTTKQQHQMNISTKKQQRPAEAENEIPLIDQTFPTVIVWKNVILFIYLHLAALYGLYLFLSGQVYLKSFIWGVPFYTMNGLGITAGCHRLWCHKTYKAKLPLRILLTIFQTVACQNSIYEWCQDHRVHHKYSETNADPHNSNRGFFFSHMGWLMCKKHPAVKVYGKKIDMSDLEADEIVMWQKKYYLPLVILVAFIIPIFFPVYLWEESWAASWFFTVQFRYCVMLHFTWLVNSVAHLYGNQPYDKSLNPRENKLVAVLALGEGWHNYHHTFPWDYKTAELGNYRANLTTAFLDFMAKIGWAYDLKTVPAHMVLDRVKRTGDGTHTSQQQDNNNESSSNIIEEEEELDDETTKVAKAFSKQHHHHNHDDLHGKSTWGWGDKDISENDLKITQTLFRLEGATDEQVEELSNDWKKIR